MNPGELDWLRPSEGARFLLELEREDDGGRQAHYHGWVLIPTAVFPYHAVLIDEGSATVTALGEPAEADLAAMLEMIAKLTARSAAKKRADGMPPWPHRVLRWRGAGRGGASTEPKPPA